MDEIVNKVKDSGLISLDLAMYKPSIPIEGLDLADQLWQGLVLKEKDFREWIKTNNWDQYTGKAVFIHCSADAIIPTWAFMLVASKLSGIAHSFIVGSQLDLEKQLIHTAIHQQNLNEFKDGRIIIKGCSDISCPDFAMVELVSFLQPVAKSIMYGEPCSTVPVYKRFGI